MSMNGKGLGRGLDALFSSQAAASAGNSESATNPFRYLAPEQLLPNPNQPRQTFPEDSLKDLAESIRARGILQPILVRPAQEPGKWQIIAGERRWRAARMAGLEMLPVIVRDFNDGDTMIAAVMENIHREDLNPIERAKGLKAIQTALNISQVDLAGYLGLQRGTVNNLLRMLSLPADTQAALAAGKIGLGHAKAIAGLPEQEGALLRDRIIELGMSARGAEMASAFWQQEKRFPWDKPAGGEKNARRPHDPDIQRLASQIGHALHCQARISGTSQRGKINLIYDSNEELFQLLEKLGLSLQP